MHTRILILSPPAPARNRASGAVKKLGDHRVVQVS
jgi:hypothetical protein